MRVVCDPGAPIERQARLLAELERFRDRGSDTGFLLIAGAFQPPPGSGPREEALARLAAAAVNAVLGDMIAYEAEGGGSLFQVVTPSRELADTQTSLGSGVALEIHTEQAFTPKALRPDVICLACIRGDPEAKTYTLHVRQILERVTPDEAAMLRRPLWTIGVDASFVSSGGVLSERRGPTPILEGPDHDPTLTFDQDLMRGVDAASEALRAKIVSIYEACRHELALSPGEILLVDNNRAVHGRSSFRPRFDGSDRLIVRSFVVFDLAASSHARVGRTVQARFS